MKFRFCDVLPDKTRANKATEEPEVSMKLEVRSVSECTVEEFIFLFGVASTPNCENSSAHFQQLNPAQERSNVIQTMKERDLSHTAS